MKKICLVLFLLTALSASLFSQIPGLGQSCSFNGVSADVLFSASPNFLYDIQRSTNFADWATVGTTNISATGTAPISFHFVDVASPPSRAFYRLRMPGPAVTFTVSGFPNPQTAGVAGNVTVTAKDAFGNTATGYRGTVHLTSNDGAAALPANYTFLSGDSGVHVFSVTLKSAGSRTITATDTTNTGISGTQTAIAITPAATTTLIAAGFPSAQIAGVAGSVTVTAKDAFFNTTPAYVGTIRLSSGDVAAALPANYTFAPGDAGTHVFSVTLKTAGNQFIRATDIGNVALSGVQIPITVVPAAAQSFLVFGFPNPQSASVPGNLTVQAKDAFGNTATGYRGTIRFTSSDGAATLPADYTFSASDSGVKGFSATLVSPGTQSITATDVIVTVLVTGTQSGITVFGNSFR